MEGTHYELGRRMTTSTANKVSPSSEVTPDCLIQLDSRYGILGETKLSLPKNVSAWESNVKQLRKYDDDLTGWWTPSEKIKIHDIVALVPLNRAVQFSDQLERVQKDQKWQFERNVAVIGFFKSSGVRDFLTLKKEKGDLQSKDISDRLRESKSIAYDLLLSLYGDRKFIDSDPPLVYLLQILWDDLFLRYAAAVPKDEENNWFPLNVSLQDATRDVQQYFGFSSTGVRSPEVPRPKSVRKALDALVDFKIAERAEKDRYFVKYKRTRADTLQRFGRLIFNLEKRKTKAADARPPRLPGME